MSEQEIAERAAHQAAMRVMQVARANGYDVPHGNMEAMTDAIAMCVLIQLTPMRKRKEDRPA